MQRWITACALVLGLQLSAAEFSFSTTDGAPPPQGTLEPVPITLEYAETPQQISWGLMKRPFIPDNHGLMIMYPEPMYASIWMFNTDIDLSVAFMDNGKVIRELHDLKAYPEMMDPNRPVSTFWDLSKYGSTDWVTRYFRDNSAVAKVLTSYVFEMNMGWFKNNDFKPGDVIWWPPFAKDGYVMHTWDIGNFDVSAKKPVLVKLGAQFPVSVWLKKSYDARDVAFLNSKYEVVQLNNLPGGNSDLTRPVVYTTVPVDYVLIAPSGELFQKGIKTGDQIKILP